ncbi:uncharacterized protein TNCV_4470151 [Trichonephila clavipes]|nr:uncharacterized protein TNCV_4470151 [Trichonephila clavipes]
MMFEDDCGFPLSPDEYAMRIATQTESALICKEYSSPFTVSQFRCSRHHRERLLRWAGVKGTHRTGRRANRPPPCSLLATVKRDIGRPVACVVCLAISPLSATPFFWPVRQCTGHLRVWFLVDDHY